MTNVIVIAVILLIVGAAALYVYKAKKRGEHCIGCPYSGKCASGKCKKCGEHPHA